MKRRPTTIYCAKLDPLDLDPSLLERVPVFDTLDQMCEAFGIDAEGKRQLEIGMAMSQERSETDKAH